MFHVLAHPAARLPDQNVHQLERRQPGRILHVGAPCHLSGQHGFGLVEGTIYGHLDGFSHKLAYFVDWTNLSTDDSGPIHNLSGPIPNLSGPIPNL